MPNVAGLRKQFAVGNVDEKADDGYVGWLGQTTELILQWSYSIATSAYELKTQDALQGRSMPEMV